MGITEIRRLQKEAKQWAMKHLRDKKIYCPILGSNVEIRRNGIEHGIHYNPTKTKIKIIYDLEEYIKKATRMIVEPHKNDSTKRVFKLSLESSVNHKKCWIYIIIKEDSRGKYYYDSGTMKKRD